MKNIVLSLLSAAALLTIAACGPKSAETQSKSSNSAIAVETVTLSPADVPQVFSVSGTVAARTTSALASQILAQVISVNAQVGDRVGAGQPLVVLNAQELDARYNGAVAAVEEVKHSIDAANLEIAAAKANLDLAEATHGRLKDLFDKRSISNQEFDESNAKLKAAQAAYDAAQARQAQIQSRGREMAADARAAQINRSYAIVSAPFSGVIVARNVEPGVVAAPGASLLTIEREGNYRLEAPVEESRLNDIRRGERVPVQIDALNRQTEGTVSEIVPMADTQSRSSTVKLDLPAIDGLHSGMFARALFPGGHQSVLTVPSGAVTENGQLDSVLVADGGFAHTRLITTGSRTGPSTVVLSGLHSGDRLIYPVPAGLSDGTPIEVRP
jgi:membrane fusion protein, multidrug efflux system